MEAFHDLWIIGDVFLKDTINSLVVMCNAAKSNKKLPMPYLYQQFNVLAYHNTRSSTFKDIARQLNPLLEALNERPKLPKYILLVPDHDIINETKAYGFGASYILGSAIHFLIRQMEMLISHRKIDMRDKKPGAYAEDTPTIIWTCMLKRPKMLNTLGSNQALSLWGRFNSVLEECLAAGPDNLRLISITVQDMDFDLSGYLTSAGKNTFWREIDRGIMKYDTGEIKLSPRSNSHEDTQDKAGDIPRKDSHNRNSKVIPTRAKKSSSLTPEYNKARVKQESYSPSPVRRSSHTAHSHRQHGSPYHRSHRHDRRGKLPMPPQVRSRSPYHHSKYYKKLHSRDRYYR